MLGRFELNQNQSKIHSLVIGSQPHHLIIACSAGHFLSLNFPFYCKTNAFNLVEAGPNYNIY